MVEIKICGFTKDAEARKACELNISMLGVVVDVPVRTPREVSLSKAKSLLEQAPRSIKTVVVSMPQALEKAQRLDDEMEADFLQIHSQLTVSEFREIAENVEKRLIGVVSVPKSSEKFEGTLSRASGISEFADFVLLDTSGESGGGTGKTHCWKISRKIVKELDTPVILAGGLKPSNVRDAVRTVNPYAVDVSSGVEASPGRKDSGLMRKFVEKAGGID